MARKWSDFNLPGALHCFTGNFLDRTSVFTDLGFAEWLSSFRRGQGGVPSAAAALGC